MPLHCRHIITSVNFRIFFILFICMYIWCYACVCLLWNFIFWDLIASCNTALTTFWHTLQWSTGQNCNVRWTMQKLQRVTQLNPKPEIMHNILLLLCLFFNTTHHKFWTSLTLKKFSNIFHPCHIKYTQQFYHIFYNSLNGNVLHYTTNQR